MNKSNESYFDPEEEIKKVHLWLDKHDIPRKNGIEEYSIIGRIKQLRNKPRIINGIEK